jgi:hypothetical protein
MKTTGPSATEPQAALPWRVVQAWKRFWFTPADPLPLGLIRICGGLILMYVTLAYTSDLQQFFGKEAWLNLDEANAFRHEFPWMVPHSDFSGQYPEQPFVQDPEEQAQLQRFVAKWDWDPRHAYALGQPYWSVWFHVTDPQWMRALHFGMVGIMFLFTIGFWTRVTGVLSWIAMLCYAQRSPGTLYGMDAIMAVVIFYLMLGPSGAALSVDRLISRYWVTWRALRRNRPAPQPLRPQPLVSANIILRAMQIHFCIIYMASGTSKLLGSAWWNGTALWYVMANYEFTPLRFDWYHDMVVFLCQHRWLWELLLSGGALYTLVTEISFPFLVWVPRMRGVMITMAILLHTGIAFAMGLMTFGLIMITMLMAFFPAEVIRRVLFATLGRGRPQLRLCFDGRVKRQLRAVSLVRAFDAVEQVAAEDATDDPVLRAQAKGSAAIRETPDKDAPEAVEPLRVIGPSGEVRTGYDLFEYVVRSLRPLWPVAALTWIPGVPQLGKKWYPGVDLPPEAPARSEKSEGRSRKEKANAGAETHVKSKA